MKGTTQKMFFYRIIILAVLVCTYIVNGQDAATLQRTPEDVSKSTGSAVTDDASKEGTKAATGEPAEGNGSTNSSNDEASKSTDQKAEVEVPVQSGPFIDLLGERLYSLEMIDESRAQMHAHYTNEVLRGKKVVGLYFSADWCGPCRQFTPELVSFYEKMNNRRGRKDEFEIVWVSRCRDMQSYGQYFTHMNWLALPFEEASGQRGQMLSAKYGVKGIPSLVLLDEVGNVITTDARNKIPADKAGIGFPWRNPIATLYVNLVPKTLRLLFKSQVDKIKSKVFATLKGALGKK